MLRVALLSVRRFLFVYTVVRAPFKPLVPVLDLDYDTYHDFSCCYLIFMELRIPLPP